MTLVPFWTFFRSDWACVRAGPLSRFNSMKGESIARNGTNVTNGTTCHPVPSVRLVCRRPVGHDGGMSSASRPAAPPDDSAILWRRLFRLWVLMTGVWAFMGIWTTGLACALGDFSAHWCSAPATLNAGEILYELFGLPFFFLASGLLVRGLLRGTRLLIASAARSSRSR